MKRLSEADCLEAIRSGDFSSSVTGAPENVAVVLTQSWCPQWSWMRSYLGAMPALEGAEIFWVEYDLEDFFEPFMEFKETSFRNDQVPYVRYYREGKLAAESNYIDSGGFLRYLRGK